MQDSVIPPYVYAVTASEQNQNLFQGDIIRVTGELREKFLEYYPAIEHPLNDNNKFVMILTQSCDLIHNTKRSPKVDYITVCLVREFHRYINKELNEKLRTESIGNKKIISEDSYRSLLEKITRLVNNSESKSHFFLPKYSPFTCDMVALLSITIPFRFDKYPLFIENRILSLKQEFRAKIGDIISHLYGRVATNDLLDEGWSSSTLTNYVENQLKALNIIKVPGNECIEYIKKNGVPSEEDLSIQIENAIIEFTAQENEREFATERKRLMKTFKDKLFNFIQDTNWLKELSDARAKENDHELRRLISLPFKETRQNIPHI